ncbi:MAG: hypothetical protein ACOC6I_03710 [Candidatus Bipolaricaulota bacterium]
MLGIGNSNPGEDLNGPEVIGREDLYDGEGNRFLIKYYAPLELHPYYERLIEENEEDLLEEASQGGSSLDVTQRFEEEAQRLYGEDNSVDSN